MENHDPNAQDQTPRAGFKSFAFKRFVIAALLIVLVVWALSVGPDWLRQDQPAQPPAVTKKAHPQPESAHPSESGSSASPAAVHPPSASKAGDHGLPAPSHERTTARTVADRHESQSPGEEHSAQQAAAKATTEAKELHPPTSEHAAVTADSKAKEQIVEGTNAHTPTGDQAPAHTAAKVEPHAGTDEAAHADLPTGVTFVDAVIQPLSHELKERFWGWRPNDIINFTDNVNNYQRGVLEVTRRSAVLLSERISRTGSTDAFNPHLENAMNWLMVKADRYWFPSPESKYKESLTELEKYKQGLISGQASFYTRTDNIIPLLASYEDLLGSCDENLVKQKEDDGSKASYFKADDYFFYAKGVASAMGHILEAIHHDFAATIESRHGEGLLHHAIESCRQAAALDPLLITNGDLDGIFANHRAHLAAPISHARFYLGQLVKTLST